MAINTKAAIGMIYAPGRGLRWMSRTGLMQQWRRNDSGSKYVNDAGYAIPWFVNLASMDGLHTRITGMALHISNSLEFASPAVDAHPVGVVFTSYGMAQGTATTTFEKPASQANAATPVPEKFWQLPLSTLGAFRHDIKIYASNSAQTVERFVLKTDTLDGGRGN